MNDELRRVAESWLAQGRRAMVVVVLESRGVTSRRAGLRMLVSEGQRQGTLGGGHLELRAICDAEDMLAAPAAGVRERHYGHGGERQGGTVTLGFAQLDAHQLATWPEPASLFHLQLYGAGEAGAAVARVLATIECTVDWIDQRNAGYPPSSWDGGAISSERMRKLAVDVPENQVALAPVGGYYLVLTDSPLLELRIAEAILRRGDFGFFGLTGTKAKRESLADRFMQRGIARERVERVTCPIGIEGVPVRKPEWVALAVGAQLLQWCGV